MRAAELGVPLVELRATVDSESDDRGILGLDDGTPAGPLSARVEVELTGAASAEKLEALCRWALDHCPVVDAVRRAVPMEVLVTAQQPGSTP